MADEVAVSTELRHTITYNDLEYFIYTNPDGGIVIESDIYSITLPPGIIWHVVGALESLMAGDGDDEE